MVNSVMQEEMNINSASEEKNKIIERVTNKYKQLPAGKQMFVLGFMEGVLINQSKEVKQA